APPSSAPLRASRSQSWPARTGSSRSSWRPRAARSSSRAPRARTTAPGPRPPACSGAPPSGSAELERALDVGHEVGRVLDPGVEADEALTHVIAAPARAALGVGMQAAEARRRRHQLAGLQEGVGAGVRADVEAEDGAHARPAHVADVVAGAQGVGERPRVGLLALEAQ